MGQLRGVLAAAFAQLMERPLREWLLGLADAYMGYANTCLILWAALFEPRTLPAQPP